MSNVSRETPNSESSTPPMKNKPSSFYVYLIILFGAAFLMLLLAYFVQQRNSESTISDLRNSMNLSREQLLEDIQRLEEETLALTLDKEALEAQLAELQQQKDELEVQLDAARNDPVIAEQKNRADVLTSFAILEQAIRDQDYELAAQKVRVLCTGELELDLGIVDLDGREHFNPRERLGELIPLLEKRGALTSGEVVIPGADASDG